MVQGIEDGADLYIYKPEVVRLTICTRLRNTLGELQTTQDVDGGGHAASQQVQAADVGASGIRLLKETVDCGLHKDGRDILAFSHLTTISEGIVEFLHAM